MVILVMSIALYLAVAIVFLALNKALPAIASLPFQKIGVGAVVQKTGQIPAHMTGAIFPHSNGPIYREERARIAALDFVQSADEGLYFWYFSDASFKTVLGVREKDSTFSKLLRKNIVQGVFDLSEHSALITADFARKNNLKVNDTVHFGADVYTIAGIVRSNVSGVMIPADIYITMRAAQNIAASSREMQQVYHFKDRDFVNVIALDVDPQWQGDKEKAIKKLDEKYIVFSEKTFSAEVLAQIKLVSSLGTTVFVALGVVVLIVFGLLMSYNFKTREKEIAVLRMIGWSFTDMKKQFIGESALVLVVAVVLGNVLAFVSLFVLRMQKVSLTLPWELSAKPHFLPQENAINRTITTNLPITFDWVHFVIASLVFVVLFGIVGSVLLRRLRSLMPSAFVK